MSIDDLRPDDPAGLTPEEEISREGSVPDNEESSAGDFTFVLPSDPEESADAAQSAPSSGISADPDEAFYGGETVIFETPVGGEETSDIRFPADAAGDDDAGKEIPSVLSEPDVPDEPVPEESGRKPGKRRWILIAAAILLILLGVLWFILLGPGAPHYTVSFDTAGGEDLAPVSVLRGRTAKLPTPVKEGYEFIRWTLDGSSIGSPFIPSEDVTLTAEWEGMFFNLFFNSNGGTPYEIEDVCRAGDTVKFPADPVYKGHTLAGWNTADGKEFKSGSPMPASDLYLFANWIENGYKIIFDTDGGNVIQPLLLAEGAAFPSIVPSKENCTFDHWEDPKGNTVKAGDILPCQDVILHAKWKINTFKVTFDSKGGSSVAPITVNAGDGIKLPADPTLENYEFQHWEDPSGKKINDMDKLPPQDTTLTAVWKRKTFTVTFDSKGGSSVSPITVNAGDTLKLPPDPVRSGYTFGCWETSDGVAILENALLSPENITLYARWEKEYFTVEFDSEGGSNVSPVTVKNGSKLTLPSPPTRPGYSFAYWKDKYGNPVYDQAILPPEDTILYAVWQMNSTLKVGLKGDDEIKSVNATDTFINVWIYSNYSTTALESNTNVTWEISDDYGVLYDVKKYSDRITFIAVNTGSGDNYHTATIKAKSDDGQVFTVTVYPVEGTP